MPVDQFRKQDVDRLLNEWGEHYKTMVSSLKRNPEIVGLGLPRKLKFRNSIKSDERYASPLHFHISKTQNSIIIRWVGMPAYNLPLMDMDAHSRFLEKVAREFLKFQPNIGRNRR